MKISDNRGVAPLIVLLALTGGAVAVGLLAPTPTSSHFVIWNPKTWGKHKEAAQVDRAQAVVQVAAAQATTARDTEIHQAHVEITKAALSAPQTPPGPAHDATVRFLGTGLSALDQADPLTEAEHAQAMAIVQGLLSDEVAKRQAAEAAQKKAEDALSLASQGLQDAQKSLKASQDTLAAKESALRTAFDRENAVANELRNHVFLKWLAVGIAVTLAIAALYLHAGLGRVGQALHPLSKILAPDDYQKVVSAMDGATDWVHQQVISAGRKAEATAEAKAQALASSLSKA